MDEKKPEAHAAPKEVAKSLTQVTPAQNSDNSKEAEFEKDFVDVDEDADDDEQPKVKQN